MNSIGTPGAVSSSSVATRDRLRANQDRGKPVQCPVAGSLISSSTAAAPARRR
jgi:hypothetical protein